MRWQDLRFSVVMAVGVRQAYQLGRPRLGGLALRKWGLRAPMLLLEKFSAAITNKGQKKMSSSSDCDPAFGVSVSLPVNCT